MNKKKIAAIDAMALAYKAYFAFISRPLRNSKGENTSAVYGFLAQLIRVIEDIRPDYLVVAFDSKEKTCRHEMYDKYKSSRAVMPDDMIPQIQRIKDIVNALEIPLLIKSGYEADDLIAELGRQDEIRISLVMRQQPVLVGRQAEEIGLLLVPFDRRAERFAPNAVFADARLLLVEIGFLAH